MKTSTQSNFFCCKSICQGGLVVALMSNYKQLIWDNRYYQYHRAVYIRLPLSSHWRVAVAKIMSILILSISNHICLHEFVNAIYELCMCIQLFSQHRQLALVSMQISQHFSFSFSRSIVFLFLGCTLPGKWLIHSSVGGAYSQSREGCLRPHQCLWDNCATLQCRLTHCRQKRGPSLLECVKVACYLSTSLRIWACLVLQFQ